MTLPARVGIDGMNLAMARGTGIATYGRVLSQCVGGLGRRVDVVYGLDIPASASPMMREVLFFDLLESGRSRKAPKPPSPRWAAQMLAAAAGPRAVEVPLTGRTVAAPLAHRLPHYDRILNVQDLFGLAWRYFRSFGRFLGIRIEGGPQLMHWTYPVPIRLAGARNVYTVHDLIPLQMPYATLDDKAQHAHLLAACFRGADHIVTVSEASRRDLLAFFPALWPERVTNTYQACVPQRPAAASEVERVVSGGFGLQPGGYFLFFGSIEPKKNVGRLLEAHLASGLATPLVIVGAQAWKSEGELVLLRHRPAGDLSVRQIDYLPAAMLATLVQGARAVVFPSLYEGFGLPVLEAMALGTPVLTSRAGALPEVAGDAALFVNPYDPRDIAAGLRRLAGDDALCADLRARGLAQAARFGMAQYAARITALYQAVLRQAP